LPKRLPEITFDEQTSWAVTGDALRANEGTTKFELVVLFGVNAGSSGDKWWIGDAGGVFSITDFLLGEEEGVECETTDLCSKLTKSISLFWGSCWSFISSESSVRLKELDLSSWQLVDLCRLPLPY